MMKSARRWLPLALFLVLLGALAAGLRKDPREVPSPLVGRTVPEFRLPTLAAPARIMAPAEMQGQVWVLNVWASWCVACRVEHPVWVDLARRADIPLVGFNYKDQPAAATRWLGQFGNPYLQTVTDIDGQAGIELGVYGVPETYVIDRAGVIRYKHTGPVTPELLQGTLLPLIRRLRG